MLLSAVGAAYLPNNPKKHAYEYEDVLLRMCLTLLPDTNFYVNWLNLEDLAVRVLKPVLSVICYCRQLLDIILIEI